MKKTTIKTAIALGITIVLFHMSTYYVNAENDIDFLIGLAMILTPIFYWVNFLAKKHKKH